MIETTNGLNLNKCFTFHACMDPDLIHKNDGRVSGWTGGQCEQRKSEALRSGLIIQRGRQTPDQKYEAEDTEGRDERDENEPGRNDGDKWAGHPPCRVTAPGY